MAESKTTYEAMLVCANDCCLDTVGVFDSREEAEAALVDAMKDNPLSGWVKVRYPF